MAISTMCLRAEQRMLEIEKTLTAYDFDPNSYVQAHAESGEEYFFPYAFARKWKDPENGMEFWFIFAEHAPPVWILVDDSSWCKQYKRVKVKALK